MGIINNLGKANSIFISLKDIIGKIKSNNMSTHGIDLNGYFSNTNSNIDILKEIYIYKIWQLLKIKNII